MTAIEYIRATCHPRDACPCAKRHRASPAPVLPDPIPGVRGKELRRLRDKIEALDEARDVDDAEAIARHVAIVDRAAAAFGEEGIAYRQAVDGYFAAKAIWRNDTCGACGVSLLCPTAERGCIQCLTAREMAMFAEAAG